MRIFETERLYFDELKEEEIPEVIEIENDKENRKFIWQGSVEEHLHEIADPDYLVLLLHEKDSLEIKGYALTHFDFKSNVYEIRRIAITDKGKGYGREMLNGLVDYVFKNTNTNRIWLDTYTDNVKGICLYESAGFHKDGVLRQSYLSGDGYKDQIVYSLLRKEYEEFDK